jgi:prepilin-type N-terminal cleavage/methylation domain-containing protein
MRRLGRHRMAPQAGMTLVELVVAMSMMSVVLLIFTSVLASVQRTVVVNQRYSEANDEARLALQQLDRELRSGNVINDPADPPSATYEENQHLLIYTQSNLPTRGQAQCEIWKVTPVAISRCGGGSRGLRHGRRAGGRSRRALLTGRPASTRSR